MGKGSLTAKSRKLGRGGRKRQEVGGAANDFRFASIRVPKGDIFEKNDFSWDVKNVE